MHNKLLNAGYKGDQIDAFNLGIYTKGRKSIDDITVHNVGVKNNQPYIFDPILYIEPN